MAWKYSEILYSIEELAQRATQHIKSGAYSHATAGGEVDHHYDFHGVRSLKHLDELVTVGFEQDIDSVIRIAEDVVRDSFQEFDSSIFVPTFDVSGGEVDIDRYLTGEPENMVEYGVIEAPRFGRVITLCASISFSGAVSKRAIAKRGHLVTALAMAMSRLGLALEIWADASTRGGSTQVQQRILVKSPGEDVNPARIMFAFTHPGMLRMLAMPAMHSWPGEIQSATGVGFGYGAPEDPKEDLPDGTIYLPSVLSNRDVPDADVKLREILRELGIITD